MLTLRQLHPSKAQRDGTIGFGAVELGYQTLDKMDAYLHGQLRPALEQLWAVGCGARSADQFRLFLGAGGPYPARRCGEADSGPCLDDGACASIQHGAAFLCTASSDRSSNAASCARARKGAFAAFILFRSRLRPPRIDGGATGGLEPAAWISCRTTSKG